MSDAMRRFGLTMRTVEASGYEEPRDALAQLWPAFMTAALPDADWMYLPSLLPDAITDYCDAWGLNGVILTGGEDPESSPLRDQSERSILEWAAQKSLPVLGICRGLQLMAVADGGTLEPIGNHVASRHGLDGEYDWEVNSYHSSGLLDVPKSYRELARAPDHTVEAMRHKQLPWEGWMWHPERDAPFSTDDIREIRRLFK